MVNKKHIKKDIKKKTVKQVKKKGLKEEPVVKKGFFSKLKEKLVMEILTNGSV